MEKRSRNETTESEFSPASVSVVIGPDSLPMAQGFLGDPEAVPARTPENMVCLRGPCRHYWYMKTMADMANPVKTFEQLGIDVPRQHNHTCLVNPGHETDLGNDNVFECNKWNPLTAPEVAELRLRREQYDNHAASKAVIKELEGKHDNDTAE